MNTGKIILLNQTHELIPQDIPSREAFIRAQSEGGTVTLWYIVAHHRAFIDVHRLTIHEKENTPKSKVILYYSGFAAPTSSLPSDERIVGEVVFNPA